MRGETYKRYTKTHMRRPHFHKTDGKNDPNSNTDEKTILIVIKISNAYEEKHTNDI